MRSPRVADIGLAAAAAAALLVDGLTGHKTAAPVWVLAALSVVAAAPLAWRRVAPLPALLATEAGLIACLAVFRPVPAAVATAMIALFAVALDGGRRRSLAVGIATALVFVITIALIERSSSLTEGVSRVVLALGALVVGDAVRTRRELRAAAAERTARLEREREAASRRRIADERLRIARELHDTIAHALVAINVRAGVAAHLTEAEDAHAALGEIRDVSSDALGDLRATLNLLREQGDEAPTRPAQDLASLPELLERARAGGLIAEADVDVDGIAIPSPVGQAGFRIVQESLTNVLRHGHASRARVTVAVAADLLEIEVTDDGRGGQPNGQGHGLRGMAERASALGGTVLAGPRPEGGWSVQARIPLANATHQ